MLPQRKKLTYEEFLEIDKNSEERLEYMYGEIFNQASPSVNHQNIIGELFGEFRSFFKGKSCKPFISPLDLILKDTTETHRVQPDIMVICEKDGLTENSYVGVPSLVVEVLSPSTASIDFVKKMNPYMEFGVKEYWIVSPKNNVVQIFVLENGKYCEPQTYKEKGVIKSVIFEELEINLESIFEI